MNKPNGDRPSGASTATEDAKQPMLSCPLCGSDSSGESLQGLFDLPYRQARALVLRAFESGFLSRLVERAGGNVSAAARSAEMDRSYLIKLLKRRGMA